MADMVIDVPLMSNKRKHDDEAEMPPTKVFVVEFVPMDNDEPAPFIFYNFFPVPRLVRSVNEA